MTESTVLEGKGSEYAKRLGEYTSAAMKDRGEFRRALWEIKKLGNEYFNRTDEYEFPDPAYYLGEIDRIASIALREWDGDFTGGPK